MFLWLNQNKNLVTIGLLVALMAPLLGGGLSFLHRRHSIRREIKHMLRSKLDESDLIAFNFADESLEVEWEHDKEFEYKGFKYDVIKIEQQGDATIYWCWKDLKETQLYKKLHRLTAGILDQNVPLNKHQKQLSTYIKSLYFNHLHEFKINSDKSKLSATFRYLSNYISILITPLSPPPKHN